MAVTRHGGPSAKAFERIEIVPIVAKLDHEFKGSYYHMTHRATVIVRLHTSDGLVGEAYAGDEVDTLGEIVTVIRNEIAPRLRGLDLGAPLGVWEALYPVTFNILRDRRIGLVALAAVDAAVWDLFGKSVGLPLHRIWGGARSRVEMLAIGGYYGEPLGSIENEMEQYAEMGFAGVKFKIGGASPETDAARVRRARKAVGDDFVIAVDANQGYSVADAIDFAYRVDDVGLRWFEEPVGWANDRRDLATVRSRTTVPITAGQSEMSAAGCHELMDAGAIDVCNFDASWSGGPTAWLRVAAMAHTASVQMGHHEEPQTSLHLLGSQPHGTFAECFHPARDPFWWNLISNRPPLSDGAIDLPDRPGFGWDLDWDYVKRHRVEL